MLKAIRFMMKLTLFALLVLVLGNWVQWKGHTLSDHVRVQMSHAERSDTFGSVRDWATHVTKDAGTALKRKTSEWKWRSAAPSPQFPAALARRGSVNNSAREIVASRSATVGGEEIPATERQKLKDLIRELSGSRGRD